VHIKGILYQNDKYTCAVSMQFPLCANMFVVCVRSCWCVCVRVPCVCVCMCMFVIYSVDAIFSPRGRARPKSLEFRRMKADFDAELTFMSGSLTGVVCVCVCVCERERECVCARARAQKRDHTCYVYIL